MSSKSPSSVSVVAMVCGVLAWVSFVHLFEEAPLEWILGGPIALSLLVWWLVLFWGLILRDTIRRRGFWGLNFRRFVCTQCGNSWSAWGGITRWNWREIVRGIQSCHVCGFELNQWGRPITDQNFLAKWNVLRATGVANKRKSRTPQRDERIHNVNDQTQRGDVS